MAVIRSYFGRDAVVVVSERSSRSPSVVRSTDRLLPLLSILGQTRSSQVEAVYVVRPSGSSWRSADIASVQLSLGIVTSVLTSPKVLLDSRYSLILLLSEPRSHFAHLLLR